MSHLFQNGYVKDNLKFLLVKNIMNNFSEYYHFFLKYSSEIKFKSQDNTRLILVDEGKSGILLLETMMNIASLRIIYDNGMKYQETVNKIINYLKDTIMTQNFSLDLVNTLEFKLIFYCNNTSELMNNFQQPDLTLKSKDIFENELSVPQKEYKYRFTFNKDWCLVREETKNVFNWNNASPDQKL